MVSQDWEFYELAELDDRQKVELAAELIGLQVDGWLHPKYNAMRVVDQEREFVHAWNPMTNNSDAYCFAVRINLPNKLEYGEPHGVYQVYESNSLRFKQGPLVDVSAPERLAVVDNAAQRMLDILKNKVLNAPESAEIQGYRRRLVRAAPR